MTSIRDIRRQLRSIENIKKITDAMERVAAARLRRAQAQVENATPYVTKLKEMLADLASGELESPLFEQRDVKKTGVVIIAADKGLSGPYNTNVLSAADKFLKKYSKENVELLLFGKKAVEHYRRRPWDIRFELSDWGGKITLHDIQTFSSQAVSWFLDGTYDEVWLIYTHYISIMKREVMVEKFLNIGKPQTEKKKTNINFIFEPGPTEILDELLPRYCMTLVQMALYEAYASELAARIVAMQMASRNSEEMIHHLTLVRNKLRQGNITREMIEITSGAEGLK